MAKWKYDLGANGKALRESINGGGEDMKSCIETMKHLVACYDYIKALLPEDDFDLYFDDAYEMAKNELSEMKLYPDDEDGAVETVDDCLSEFYDLCDTHRIWISI